MRSVEEIADEILRLFVRDGYKPGEPLMERVITSRYARTLQREERQNLSAAIELLVCNGYIETSDRIDYCYILTNQGYNKLQNNNQQ